MSYQYEIYENNSRLLNLENNKYIEFRQPKFFNGDILDSNYKLVKSPIREKKSLVGIFSTSQTQRFGKNKRGNIIYLVQTLENNLPSFLIAYGGKLKGKIAVKFKFSNWNEKLPTGEIIDIIGNYSPENMENILMNHYSIYPKRLNLSIDTINPLESEISRKDYFQNIFSIDPDNCMDIDDSLSIVNSNGQIIVGVHIAQPNYWLKKEDVDTKMNYQFSTLYLKESRKDLWGEELTLKASLSEGDKKPAYTTLFYFENNILVKVEDFPSWIINKKKLTYDNASDYDEANNLYHFTSKLTEVNDFHELVSYWMVKTNSNIGTKYASSKAIPYRVNKQEVDFTDSRYDGLPKDIRNKFISKKIESAEYSLTENKHETLGIENYCHFTSPIRRLIDTWIHFYVTYPSLYDVLKIDCDKINYFDSQTKKFHRQIELDGKLESIFRPSNSHEVEAYVYQILSDNTVEIYMLPINEQELGFIKLRLYNMKFDYMVSKERTKSSLKLSTNEKNLEVKVGDKIMVKLDKIDGVLPNQKIKVYPIDNIINIEII